MVSDEKRFCMYCSDVWAYFWSDKRLLKHMFSKLLRGGVGMMV